MKARGGRTDNEDLNREDKRAEVPKEGGPSEDVKYRRCCLAKDFLQHSPSVKRESVRGKMEGRIAYPIINPASRSIG